MFTCSEANISSAETEVFRMMSSVGRQVLGAEKIQDPVIIYQ